MMFIISTPGSTNSRYSDGRRSCDMRAAHHEAEDEDEQQRRNPGRDEGLDRHAHHARTSRRTMV